MSYLVTLYMDMYALSSLVTSVVLYSLTQATLKSPGKDEAHVCGYIYIYNNYNFIMPLSQKFLIIILSMNRLLKTQLYFGLFKSLL